MGLWNKIVLSGSTDGEGIKVTGTAPSLGAVVHTAVTGAADSIDEIWLYAHSNVTTLNNIGFAIGPTTATGTRYKHTVTADDRSGLHLVMAGLVLRNAKVVKAFAATGTDFVVFGYVNRYTT